MVNAFFGQGAAQGFQKQQALDTQTSQVGVERTKLALLQEQLRQKAAADRAKRGSDTINSNNEKIKALFMVSKQTGAKEPLALARQLQEQNRQIASMYGVPQLSPTIDLSSNQQTGTVPTITGPSGQPAPAPQAETQGTTGQTTLERVQQILAESDATKGLGKQLTDIAKMAGTLLTQTKDPVVVRRILERVQSENPDRNLANGIGEIIRSLPATPEEMGAATGRAQVAKESAITKRLTDLGIDPQVAGVIASGGAQAAGFVAPMRLGPSELKGVRQDIQQADNVIGKIDSILPMIDDQTVGIIAAINEQFGPTQQIPGVKQLVNALGSVVGVGGEEAIKKAVRARAAFREVVGPISRFITDKGGRLNNEDRAFAVQATGLLSNAASADDAKAIVERLKGIAQKIRDQRSQTLQSGQIRPSGTNEPTGERSAAPQGGGNLTVEIDPNVPGGFIVKDENGDIVNTIPPGQ